MDNALLREAAIAWSLENRPTIVGIGIMHTVTGEDADMEKIVRIREAAFEIIKQKAVDRPIFAFEERCDVDPVDWKMSIVAAGASWSAITGQPMLPLDEVERTMKKDSPQSRAVRELGSQLYPICGEEWPYYLMGILVTQVEPFFYGNSVPVSDPRVQTLLDLKDRLIILRSEVALIRTIEAMQETDKTTAIVSMGAYHIQDMRAAASEYGLTFEANFPEGKEPDPRPSYIW